MSKEVKCEQFRTSSLFKCYDCRKQWQDLKKARQQAYQHAKNTGHRVRGEIGWAYHYNYNSIK